MKVKSELPDNMRYLLLLLILGQVESIPNQSSVVKELITTKFQQVTDPDYIIKLSALKGLCENLNIFNPNNADNDNPWGMIRYANREKMSIVTDSLVWIPTLTQVAIISEGQPTWVIGGLLSDVQDPISCEEFKLSQLPD